ncbi:MAG: VOC family protein [Burkholderiaceae bacterium]|nr:VOC family protein [Burkholderiaceae bacterium]
MQTNPVIWFEIYVQDMARAKAFYETLLQRTLEKLNTPDTLEGGVELWAFPMDSTAMGASGALAKMEGCGSGGGGTLVYFTCEDCAVEAARAAPAGGSILKEKFAIGEYGHIALINDTEGNVVGLHSMK